VAAVVALIVMRVTPILDRWCDTRAPAIDPDPCFRPYQRLELPASVPTEAL
jgi:hypothetical protein